ncbi:unnamed protein product [Cochlearia groenlandica]
MEQVSEILKNNKTEDINWFCSLSESELDLVISLKKLAIQRAKTCGHQELALVFDLSMLRSLGLVLMEYLRKRVHDDASLVPISNKVLDNCNLLHTHDDNDTIDIEEILTEICCNSRSRKKSRKRFTRNLNTNIFKSTLVSSMLKLYAFLLNLKGMLKLLALPEIFDCLTKMLIKREHKKMDLRRKRARR